MAARLVQIALFGALALNIFPVGCSRIEEPDVPADPLAVPFTTVVWKLRDPLPIGTPVTVSAQHRAAGAAGRFRFAVYATLQENYEFPHLVQVSEPHESPSADLWSSWTFTSQHPVNFVGVAWDGNAPPIALTRKAWANPLSLSNGAYVGLGNQLQDKWAPLKGQFRVEVANQADPVSSWVFGAALLSLAALALYLFRQGPLPLATPYLIAFTIGLIFCYRLWATLEPSYWSWGSHFLSFLPPSIGLALLAALPMVGLPLLLSTGRVPSVSLNASPARIDLVFIAVMLVLAWGFRATRVYGDWAYGFMNHEHAPLMSAVYHLLQPATAVSKWLADHFNSLISLVAFVPFLLTLIRFVRSQERGLAIPMVVMFFLSGSALQCFFGYVEIYSIPMALVLAYSVTTFKFLERRLPLWVPTLIAFVAYLTHLTEGALIFSVAFLWIYHLLVNRPAPRQVAWMALSLAAAAIALTGLCYLTLFYFKFNGDTASFRQAFSHYGFEILWGAHRHSGVLLPAFSTLPPIGSYTRPGPDFPVFSVDNLIKVSGFLFHYSLFYFALPVLVLFRDGLRRRLRDPKVAFVFISFSAYTLLIAVMYVGWVPLIRDWDLFAVYALLGALLTYLLLRDERNPQLFAAMAAVNLLQTIPWILLNHYPTAFPW